MIRRRDFKYIRFEFYRVLIMWGWPGSKACALMKLILPTILKFMKENKK